MKSQRDQSKPSNLQAQIEIIRDGASGDKITETGTAIETKRCNKHHAYSSLDEKDTALNALAELVERLESFESLDPFSSKEHDESKSSTQQKEQVDIGRYLELFQKQYAALKIISWKLN